MKLQLTNTNGGVRLAVWAKPRASKSRLLGVREGALEVALAAPPVDGAANAELLRTLARALGVSVSAVELVRGSSGRTKLVEIRGLTAERLAALLTLQGVL
jgi:uncharacterized protein (TIGR00251 family)